MSLSDGIYAGAVLGTAVVAFLLVIGIALALVFLLLYAGGEAYLWVKSRTAPEAERERYR